MIFLHELGHYLAAKRAGMKVTEFFIGFGPRIWSFRRGETEYGVKAIPAGAYVRIIGMNNLEEVDPADEPRTYRAAVATGSACPWSLAGSAMHFAPRLRAPVRRRSPASAGRPTELDVDAVSRGLGRRGRRARSPATGSSAIDGQPVDDVRASSATSSRPTPATTVDLTVERDGQTVVAGTIGWSLTDGVGAASSARAGDRVAAVDGEPVPLYADSSAPSSTPTAGHGRLSIGTAAPLRHRGHRPGRRCRPTATGFLGVGRALGRRAPRPSRPSPTPAREFGTMVVGSVAGHRPALLADRPRRLRRPGRDRPTTDGRAGRQLRRRARRASRRPSSAVVGDADRPMSIIGIVDVGAQIGARPAGPCCCLLAMVNIFLGLFNLVPLLPLRRRPRRHRHLRGDPRAASPAAATGPTWPSCMPVTYAVVLLCSWSSGCRRSTSTSSTRSAQRRRPVGRSRERARQTRVPAPHDPPDHGRRRRRRRRRAGLRPVDDDHQDGRRRGHARSRSTPSPAPAADIVRCTCNEIEAAEGLAQIVPRSPVPIIADIHHQYRMALAALEAGVHGLRLNPGNIRRPEHIKAVAAEAKDRGVPDPHRGQRRLARPGRSTRSTAAGHARGHGRVGPAGAGLLRRGRLRRRQDLGEGVQRAADDRGLPAARRGHRPPAAPRRHRGRPAARRAGQGHRRHRHAAGRGHRRHHPLLAHRRSRSRRPRPGASCSRRSACGSARTST